MCVPLSHASFIAFTEQVLPRFAPLGTLAAERAA
jgi:hypothetical protein